MRTIGTRLTLEVGEYVRNAGTATKVNKTYRDSVTDTAKAADKHTQASTGAAKATDQQSKAAKVAGKATADLGDSMRGTARHASHLEAEIEGLQKQLVAVATQMAAADNPDAFKGFRKELAQVKRDIRDRMDLKKILTPAGEDGATGFFVGFSQKIGPLMARAPVSVPLLGAFAAASPLIAATVTAGLLAGLAGGTVAVGVKLALTDPAVKKEADAFGDFLAGQAAAAFDSFRPATVAAMDFARGEIAALGDDLQDIGDEAASFLLPLTRGVTGFVRGAIPGIKKGLQEAGPVVAILEAGFVRMGSAVGSAISTIAGGAGSAAFALGELFLVMEGGIATVSLTTRVLTELYPYVRGIGGVVSGFAQEQNEAGDATSDFQAELERMKTEFTEYSAATELATAQADRLKFAQQGLESAFDAVAPKAGLLTAQVDGLRRASDLLFGSAMRGVEANEAWQASFDDLSSTVEGNKDAFKRNANNLTIHTEAGRSNRDALEALLVSNNELFYAQVQAGVSIESATKKHQARTAAVEKEAKRLGLNRAETQRLITTYGRIPPNKSTDLFLNGMNQIVQRLTDLYVMQRALATGRSIESVEQSIRKGSDNGPSKPGGGYAAGGWTGPGPKHQPAGVVHADEFVITKQARRGVERQAPGFLDSLNRSGRLPGYAAGGLVAPVDASRRWPFEVDVADSYVMSKREAARRVMPAFGPWPSSPAAQRGDSGVWRSILGLVRNSGIPYSFGNAYRHGDPLWHGCVPMDTQILTRRGWITYDEVRVNEDETIGYNPTTGKNEWTRIVGLHRYQDAEVWTIGNSWWRAECTPGHKWLVDQQVSVQIETTCTECGREFATGRGMTTHRGHVHKVYTPRAERYQEMLVQTRDFKQNTRIHLAKPAELGSSLPITDDEAELIGWVMADGYMEQRGPTIVQSKPEQVEYLSKFMRQFPHAIYLREPEAWQRHLIHRFAVNYQYWDDLATRSEASKRRAVDFVLSLSTSQREAWLRGFLSADGTRDRRTQNERLGYAAFQVSGPVAEAVKIAAYLQGYRPDTRVKTVFDRDHYGRQPMEHIGLRTPVTKARHLKRLNTRQADVWCPTTELGTWTARQGEEIFLTGNSGRAVDFMGYNQDRLARFFMGMQSKVLELIHTTDRGGYYVSRGRRRSSMGIQGALHRNHLHVAMAGGGYITEPIFGVGQSGRTYSFGERGVERVTPGSTSGGTVVNHHAPITVTVVSSARDPRQVGREVARALAREMGQQADVLVRGG